MDTKQNHVTEDDINLPELIINLWRNKALILTICIICMLSAYVYKLNLPKNFKIIITINEPNNNLFKPFSDVYEKKNNYQSLFLYNLLKLQNLNDFVEQNEKIENFSAYLEKKEITAKQFLKDYRFGQFQEGKKNNVNTFFLIIPEEFKDNKFLDDYIKFIKNKTIFEIIENIRTNLLIVIEIHKNNLDISKKINLKNPILLSVDSHSLTNVIYKPSELYYEDSKVLSEKLIQLEKLLVLLVDLDKALTTHDPILGKEMYLNDSKSLNFLLALGLLFGLFLSVLIIFFRKILKKN